MENKSGNRERSGKVCSKERGESVRIKVRGKGRGRKASDKIDAISMAPKVNKS